MNQYVIHQTQFSDSDRQRIESVFGSRLMQQSAFTSIKSNVDLSRAELDALRVDLRCDINRLPEGFAGSDVRLIVTDMDSTLIAIECIDEIADMLDLKPQVSAITESAMRGEIDFPTSLKKRVGLLAGLPVSALEQVYDERLRLNPGAEDLLAHLKQTGVRLALVSGGFTFFTDRLKQRLALDYTLSNVLSIEQGQLTGKVLGDIVDGQAKADLLLRLQDELGLRREQIIAMGDGANDLTMMAHAGLSVAYHAKPAVQAATDIQINFGGLDSVIHLLQA